MKTIYKDKILRINFLEYSKTLEIKFLKLNNKDNGTIFKSKMQIIIEYFKKLLPEHIICNLSKTNYLFTPTLQLEILEYLKQFSFKEEIEIKCILPKDEFSKISIFQTFDTISNNFQIIISYFEEEKKVYEL